MSNSILEHLILGTNNLIGVQLTENYDDLNVTATRIDINLLHRYTGVRLVQISRVSPFTDGVSFAAGALQINPAELTEDLTGLIGEVCRCVVTVTTDVEPSGVDFGGADSAQLLYVSIEQGASI
ncbi:MAG: hypothetical protein AAF529_08850 [Pseudomonadota bacterium]